MKISILHGSDGMWHLFNDSTGQAMDWPPLYTKEQAEKERDEFYRELGQLAADEKSEAIVMGDNQ